MKSPAAKTTGAGAVLRLSARCFALQSDDPSTFRDEGQCASAGPDNDTGAPRCAREMCNVGTRIGQHVMHARLLMRRLRHRTVETDTMREQPAKRLRHVVGEHATEYRVVAMIEVAVEARHVVPVIFRTIDDAFSPLVGRTGCRDRADRPGRRTAELRILFDQQDIGACCPRLDCRSEPRAAATDDDDIEGLVGRIHDGICAARCPAVVPAIRPKTEPAIRPVPPG